MPDLDELDLRIIGQLQDDGRKPSTEIARALRVPRTTVARRIERLVNDGIITVRVSVNDDLIFFDYYIPVEGGITKKAIILATKHFLTVQKLAVLECGGQEVLG